MIEVIGQPYVKFKLSDEQIKQMNDYGDMMKEKSRTRLNLVLTINFILLLIFSFTPLFILYMIYFSIITIYIIVYKVKEFGNPPNDGKIKYFHTYMDSDDEITGVVSTHFNYSGYFEYGIFVSKVRVWNS